MDALCLYNLMQTFENLGEFESTYVNTRLWLGFT